MDYMSFGVFENTIELKSKVIEEIREEYTDEYKKLVRLIQYTVESHGVILTEDEAKQLFLSYIVK